MKRPSDKNYLPLLLLLALTLAAPACRQTAEEAPPQAAKSAAESKDANLLQLSPEASRYARLVEETAGEQMLAVPLRVTGRIAVNEERTAHVGAFHEGRIENVYVQLGDAVRAGQPLAQMHTHEVHDARADYDKARAELAMKERQVALSQATFERAERLYRAKALAYREVEEAESALHAARQEVRRAQAEVERAIGHLEHLGLSETGGSYDDRVRINAPIAGIVIKREVTPGTAVTPGSHAFTIANLTSLWVIAEVGEAHLASLRRGAPVSLEVAAYPGATFTGKIERLGEQLNPQTRTLEVRCLVDNRAGRLKPEMYATININLGERRAVLMVSEAALQEIDGQTVVFVARGEAQYEKRLVTVGRRDGALREIQSGLQAGERVVTEGSFLLKSEFLKSRFAEEE